MNTLTINIEGIKPQTIAYPSTWNEMNKKQLLFATQFLNSNLLISEFRVKAVQAFLGKKNELFKQYALIKRAQDKAKGERAVIDFWQNKLTHLDELIYCISESLSFIYKDASLTKQLLPRVLNLYGCADNMSDLSFIEFAKADIFFSSYRNTNDIQYIDKLVAVLYRPARLSWYFTRWFNYTAKKRVDFSDECLKRNLTRISKLPIEIKQAILFHFTSCRSAIVAKYPNVFTQGDSDGNTEGFGYAGLLTELAGTKFGDQDKTAYTNIHDILRHLEMEKIKANKLKAQYDEHNRA